MSRIALSFIIILFSLNVLGQDYSTKDDGYFWLSKKEIAEIEAAREKKETYTMCSGYVFFSAIGNYQKGNEKAFHRQREIALDLFKGAGHSIDKEEDLELLNDQMLAAQKTHDEDGYEAFKARYEACIERAKKDYITW
jgi:hypothetical protein